MKWSLIHIAAALSLVTLLGCGGSDTSGDTAADTTSGSDSSVVPTEPSSTEPATTAPTTTGSTASTSTTTPASDTSGVATSSTIVAVPAGWIALDSMPSEAYPPCCASNWTGAPSPPMTDGSDLPDGIYNAQRVDWSPDDPSRIVVDVRRFEACSLLPQGGCEPLPEGYEYQADELGIVDEPVRQMTITLDDTVRVGVGGWNVDLINGQGNGADLVALMLELKSAYDEVLAAPFLAGGDSEAIIAGLQANPARGFGPPSVENYYGALVYSYDGAPPILFQQAFEHNEEGEQPMDATTILLLTAIQFDHGITTLYFYAGYYP